MWVEPVSTNWVWYIEPVPPVFPPKPEICSTGLVTASLKVIVIVPRLEQTLTELRQPAARTSISEALVVAAMEGDNCADVTPPVLLSAADGAKKATFAPDTVVL